MLATSHLVITTVLLIAARKMGLDVSLPVIVWAYLLGNVIDLDHIIGHPQESILAVKGFFQGERRAHSGRYYYMRSRLQEPWFGVATLAVSLPIMSFTQNKAVLLPVVALVLHIALDAVMKFNNHLGWPVSKKGFTGFIPSNTLTEYIISVPLVFVAFYLAFSVGVFSF